MATLFEKLIAANLPVESATESGAISMLPGAIMTDAQRSLFSDIILEHFQPSLYADLLVFRGDQQQLKNEYLSTIATLQQIEDTVSPTNAQVISAVKFIAKTLRLLLKLIVRLYK